MRPAALAPSELSALLERTSRTFALAIPFLEEDAREAVGVAYLLFRIADTLEDAPRWGRDRRRAALASFTTWLGSPAAPDAATWKELVAKEPPIDDPGCLELLTRADDVLAMASAEGPAIVDAARRTAIGMTDFVSRQDEHGRIVLESEGDLRRYAYVVAGIVGELLTELFVMYSPSLAGVRARLDEDAAAFGEALQLVNIVKDASSDRLEGRQYIPEGMPRAAVVELARGALGRAARYVGSLEAGAAPPGIVAFCELPLRLARATLDRLDAGALKLEREAVMAIVASVAERARARAVARPLQYLRVDPAPRRV